MENYRLDLHKTKHIDAKRIVIRFIEAHWTENAELEIITGNSLKMKGIVIDILEEYKLTYQIGRRYDLYNNGYILTCTGD